MTEDFKDYADFCFETFGDQVKHWITINSISQLVQGGYLYGYSAPGRCSGKHCVYGNSDTTQGNSSTEPYIALKNILVAEGKAIKVYKEKYQDS